MIRWTLKNLAIYLAIFVPLMAAWVVLAALVIFPVHHAHTTCQQHSITIRVCYTQSPGHCALYFHTPDGVIGGPVPCREQTA